MESANIWRVLGVKAMDLIAMPGLLIGPDDVERDLQGLARRVSEPEIELRT